MAENYLYYVLVDKDNGAKLSACIDVDTVDDDEPEVEYLNDDGVWGRTTSPDIFTTADGEELSCKVINDCETENWDFISQALVDNENIVDDAVVYVFDECYLIISDDDEITYSSCAVENCIEQFIRDVLSTHLGETISKLNEVRIAIFDALEPHNYMKVRTDDWETGVLDFYVDGALVNGYDLSVEPADWLDGEVCYLQGKLEGTEYEEAGSLIMNHDFDGALKMLQ